MQLIHHCEFLGSVARAKSRRRGSLAVVPFANRLWKPFAINSRLATHQKIRRWTGRLRLAGGSIRNLPSNCPYWVGSSAVDTQSTPFHASERRIDTRVNIWAHCETTIYTAAACVIAFTVIALTCGGLSFASACGGNTLTRGWDK